MTIDAARLRSLLRYAPTTGVFTWIVARGCQPAGAVAGRPRKNDGGRLEIRVDGRLYNASRLAWLYMTDEWPSQEVDHVDTDPSNDRWKNLRDVSTSVNGQNKRRGTSPTGLIGAHAYSNAAVFRARIVLDGKQRHIGSFKTPEEAHAAYVAEKRRVHPGCTL